MGLFVPAFEGAWSDNEIDGHYGWYYWRKEPTTGCPDDDPDCCVGDDCEPKDECVGDDCEPEPEPDPELDPEPDPEPDPDSPYIEEDEWKAIKPGLAAESEGNAHGSITNAKFGVSPKPIPTSEELTGEGCTDIVGKVENLGLYTMVFKEHEYTYYADWYKYGWVYYPAEYSGEGIDRELIEKAHYEWELKNSGTLSRTFTLNGEAPFYKINPVYGETKWYSRDSITITTEGGVYNQTFGSNAGYNCYGMVYIDDDLSRSAELDPSRIFANSAEGDSSDPVAEAQEWLDGLSGNIFDFWEKPIQDYLADNYNGGVYTNGEQTYREECWSQDQIIPKTVKNNSIGSGYSSSGTVNFDGGGGSKSFSVNSVRVHTPIYNELIVEPQNKNQLENTDLASGSKIVTLGETVDVTLKIDGDSYYYSDITQELSKYVKKYYIECELCGQTIQGVIGKNELKHSCKTDPTKLKDNKKYTIRSVVIAENEPGLSANATINMPDSIYVLTQEKSVYVAGKMYDLEVRATDDKGWEKGFKGKVAQKLNALPVGEEGDNAVSAYKYGIKLGYRAYFDLKTLGVATKDVTITPKIYYIKPDGTVVTDFDMYYRTSLTTYKQIIDNGVIKDANDINIKMKMNTTYGDQYNDEFGTEKSKTLNALNNIGKAVDYSILDSIGGLKKISLDSETTTTNALMTMYNGSYITTPDFTNSRRWYGEVYVPASTVVAEKDSTIEGIARGLKTYTKGYLLVTFDTIQTTTREGEQYLQYSTARNPNGVEDKPYILMDEKAGKGATTSRVTLSNGTTVNSTPITLPNGATVKTSGLGTEFYETSAPIIIYDVSLRANNDYEDGGTH